jgi:hypothetical protein
VCVGGGGASYLTSMQSALLCVICLAAPYLSTLFHKQHDFREKKKAVEKNACAFILYKLLSETFPILRTIPRNVMINTKSSSFKVPVIQLRF